MATTEKITICKNKKGLYAEGRNFSFGLIDKKSLVPLQEGEEWEAEIIRYIIDKRGKEVPILRPVKRVYKFDETRGVFTCGSHAFKPSSIFVKEILDDWDYEIRGEATSPDGEVFPFSVSWYTFQDWESVPEEIKNKVEYQINEIKERKKRKFKEFLARKKEEEFQNFLEFLKQKIAESEEKALRKIEDLKEKIFAIKVWTKEVEGPFPEKQRYFIYSVINPDDGSIRNKEERIKKLEEKIQKIHKELEEWKKLSMDEKMKIEEEELDIKVRIYRFVNDEFIWDTWSFVKEWLFPE